MTSDDTKSVLDGANARAVALMLDKLEDHDVAVIYQAVGGVGPIADLASDAMRPETSTSNARPAVRA